MHTFLIIYQWIMYGLVVGIAATCVIGELLILMSREAKDAARTRTPRRSGSSIHILRPLPSPTP